MSRENSRDTVIFSLPGSSDFSYMEAGKGDDTFMVQAFLKEKEGLQLNGQIRPIQKEDIRQILSTWKLSPAPERHHTGGSDYQAQVQAAVEAIRAGEFEKVVLAAESWETLGLDLEQVFFNLKAKNPMAFVYAFQIRQITMLGASPEKLLLCSKEGLETEALGGTLLNGAYDHKEVIEHRQIVEYIETVLKKQGFEYSIAEREVKNAGQIQHLSSKFSLVRQSFKANLNLAYELHPTSAVCGLPYKAAIDFIKKNEKTERNFYSGFLGFIKGGSEFQFYVNLRCAEFYAQGVKVFAGAGINRMSDPAREWEEVNNKMQTIVSCLK